MGLQMLSRLVDSIRTFWAVETGGEVIEYALIAGLVIVVAITLIGKVGAKVVARWTSVNSSM